MKRANKRKKYDAIILVLTIVLFAALIAVTTVLFLSFNRNTVNRDNSFDLDGITSKGTHKDNEILSEALIPEFIGLTVNGQRKGISVSARAVADIYGNFAPVISRIVRYDNARLGTEEEWKEYAEATESVYIRYHSQFADIVIGTLADIACGENRNRDAVFSYIYEMFFLPGYGEEQRGLIATRSMDGDITVYSAPEQLDLISSADISKLIMSYGTQLKKFTFAEKRYEASSYTEPVFVDAITTSNIIISNKIASMMQANMMGINSIMRVFGINPDKLLSVHTEDDGVSSYTDRSGVLYAYESAIEYKAADDGGIEIKELVGYTENIDIGEYIHAAYSVVQDISAIYSNCTGGYADMYLSSVWSDGRNVKVELRYSYDNIRITDIEPAFIASFKDGKLVEARLFTVAVNNTGYRNESRSEWWFFDYLKRDEHVPNNVGLVYRSDFVSNSVVAEWSATVKSNDAQR